MYCTVDKIVMVKLSTLYCKLYRINKIFTACCCMQTLSGRGRSINKQLWDVDDIRRCMYMRFVKIYRSTVECGDFNKNS